MTTEPSLGNATRGASLNTLAGRSFDVLVIGGGIGAACAAWDAALRGLDVALVERLDFGAATSAQSFKVLHGGIRYLQHLDLVRLRESCSERGAFLRIAPHLTRPMPIAVPTYGLGIQSQWVFGAALAVLELFSFDRNRLTRDPARHIPRPYLLSRKALLARFPALEGAGLTGAGVFFDGQIVNPPRAVLAIIRAAAARGAVVANYCEAEQLLLRDGRVIGARVRDLLGGEAFDLRAKVTLNATGPFAPSLAKRFGAGVRLEVPLSRDMALVVRRQLDPDMAVAVQTKYRDPDAVLSRGNRHLFVAPWRERYTLIGVNSRVYTEDAYELSVTEQEIAGFIAEINDACPALAIRREEISVVNAGLLPFGENVPGTKDLSFGKRSHIIDHAAQGGPEGLLTGMSVRWTMGRLLGEKIIDLAEVKLGRAPSASRTAVTPVWGGDIESVEQYAREVRRGLPPSVSDSQATRIFQHYGTDWRSVAGVASLAEGTLPQTEYLVGEVRHAVRSELAATLSDVVMRRLDLGSGECPEPAALTRCAAVMAEELGWDAGRQAREIRQLRASYPFASPGLQYPAAPP
jgi:glycerol-3-phosphate dehydrogenase